MHAASIVSSLLIIFIYDNVIEARALDTLLAMTAAIALLIWVEHSCRRMRTARLADFTARFDGAIAELSFRTVARSPLDSSEAHSGRVQVNRLRRLLIGRDLATLIGAVCDLPCVVLSLICLLAIAGPVCLVPVACSGALLAYHMLSAKRIVASAAQMADARAAADSQLEETILNMDALREVGAEHAWVARTGDVVGHGASRRLNHMHLNARLQSVSGAASSFASVLTLAGCALLAMDNVISSGALFTAMTIVYRMMGPVQSLAVVLPRIAQIRSGLRRLDDLARVAQRQTAAPVAARPGGVAGRIKVAGVGLRYGQNGPLVLRSVDLALVPGELVGIIGPTGSGKTSLLRVIAGQIEARVGTVTLDDTDLRQFDGFELSRIIGHVPDAPSFFSGTVLDNMRLVRPGVTADDIRSVLAGLGLSPLSPALPFGLETPLDHGGGLALGDLQLLGLARAMLVQPRVLLIDDTLSALDLDVQRLVLARLQAIKARTAVLIATSSPSLLAALDRVVVLGDGQIKDNGPPQAVLPKLLSSRSLKAA
jgi:ABC-type bacteriocin/lantibiotic exporter with double-glycine peptidase domain